MDIGLGAIFVLGFLGLCFGSFAGAQVWRLRARQLIEDKEAGEPYDKKEYKRLVELTRHKGTDDRSRCLSCNHTLAWYDLLPLASWLSTGGKCRYCRTFIGWFELLMELGTALLFVASYIWWPVALTNGVEIAQFALWLICGVMMAILFAYDVKWFLLPDRIVFPAITVAAAFALLELTQLPSGGLVGGVVSLAGALTVLSGLYLVLWLASRGRWIGFGDVKLGIILGLLIGRWELAFLALFIANLIGCLIVLPGLITKTLSRTTQIPFGPMLIGGFLLAFLWGESIINWYLSTTVMLMV